MSDIRIIHGDCLTVLQSMEAASVDLVFCSPPYEAARTYGMGFDLRGQDWVDWCIPRYLECLRVCRGLVAWVVEGQTKQYRYSAGPILLMADLHRRGVHLRKPPAYKRVGIPGSGGPDWLRNDYEFVVCATNGGKLHWSDNTAMGHTTKYPPGGNPSHRTKSGRRVMTRPRRGSRDNGTYSPPEKANPGNVIECHGGGGHFGSWLAHENEAPFPEKLAEFFVRSFCPPGGVVLDPFCGSGTTLAVAKRCGRGGIGIDIRETQTALTGKRLEEVAA